MSKALAVLWKNWKRIAFAIGSFQSRVLLSIFYFLILSPFSIVYQLTHRPKKMKSTWQKSIRKADSLEELRNQY